MTLSLEEIEKLEALSDQGNLDLICFEEHIWLFAERTPATVFDTLLSMAKRSIELEKGKDAALIVSDTAIKSYSEQIATLKAENEKLREELNLLKGGE